MEFTLTPEQLDCIAAARDTTDNLAITALAGAAKTSTLILMAEALPRQSILALAFNKKIATEMKERLPLHCDSKTLNGLGHGVWWEKLGKRRIALDASKVYRLLTEEVSKLDPDTKSRAYESFSDLMRTIDFAKTCGYVPSSYEKSHLGLMDDSDFFAHLPEVLEDWEEQLVKRVMLASIHEGFEGTIDFNDQIYLPTVFFCAFPYYEVIMVDEAQDLSALNHAMLAKLAKRSRVIAVGDPCQAIYGFRGAHEDSMNALKHEFKMRELFLTVSFRCPIAVVEEARWRAPAMQFPAWAKEGRVQVLPDWGPDTLQDGDVIICRNNAPLFNMAINLLKHGRYPELPSNDIGKVLIRIMKKFGKTSMSTEDARKALEDWKTEKLRRSREKGSIYDQAECIEVFLDQSDTLGGAIAYAQHIFATSGPIKLMTGHKAKGLEFPRVFFLDEHLLSKKGQDNNLRYVIQTRAQESLFYVNSDNFARSSPSTSETTNSGSED